MATGEASGDMMAAALAEAMRELRPDAEFSGIGGERMRAAGFTITASTAGWASIGPLEAIAKIPALTAVMLRHAFGLRADPVDLVVLIDFGAFNLRFARTLRAIGYAAPILYFFPPSAWIDNPGKAVVVTDNTRALTVFEHQRNFYRSLGLPIGYVGHPLGTLVSPRAAQAVSPNDGGTVALLPGSRAAEVRFHLPRLLEACRLLLAKRPRLEVVVSVADGTVAGLFDELLAHADLPVVRRMKGARAALDQADVALVSSGTAVLEAALREVPTVALYVVSPAQARIGRRMYRGRYITLPNLLLDRELVPEFVQEDATPQALASAAEELLLHPTPQIAGMREVRAKLGAPDALHRCAQFALETAKAS